MQCSNEALVWLFYNLSSSSFLLLLFLYSSSTLLSKLLYFVGSYPLIQRSQNEYDYTKFSDEEEEVEEEEEEYGDERYNNYRANYCMQNDHLVADIIHGGESLLFPSDDNSFHRTITDDDEEEEESMMNPNDDEEEEEEDGDDGQVTSDDQDQEYGSYSTEQLSAHDSSPCSGSEHHHDHYDHDHDNHDDDEIDSLDGYEEIIAKDDPAPAPTPVDLQILAGGQVDKQRVEPDFSRSTKSKESKKLLVHEKEHIGEETSSKKLLVHEKDHIGQETLSKKLLVHEKDHIDEETFYGDSCTNGSTSKSSSEWRSSINCRDSGTDDPFSSSSRGSCPKWETYTVYQKYDEEMLFLHRVSAQKLQETESLRSIQACPRSISERIVHKFAAINKKPSADIKHNPYYELEAAYVAQICLTWEALNWNYKNFERKRSARKDFDCPAAIAQQFQQFQVLLQRYNETEPYEKGRRPEVYARMRLVAPKLLMVPEYRDYEDDQKDEGFGSRISADSFVVIIEDGIQTFMNFLKADKERPYQIIKAMLGWKRKGLVDPKIVQLMKKVNAKKKMKLKDLGRTHRYCIRKKKPKVEKMEILMSLIDLKVVSRVLRMIDLSEQQLHWCEEKMSKVKIFEGGLQRDSSPLFFPAH